MVERHILKVGAWARFDREHLVLDLAAPQVEAGARSRERLRPTGQAEEGRVPVDELDAPRSRRRPGVRPSLASPPARLRAPPSTTYSKEIFRNGG